MSDGRDRLRTLVASLVSDGTLSGTIVTLNGRKITNVAAVDLHLGPDASTLLISVGHAVIDYGQPASVDVHDVSASIQPSATPPDPE